MDEYSHILQPWDFSLPLFGMFLEAEDINQSFDAFLGLLLPTFKNHTGYLILLLLYFETTLSPYRVVYFAHLVGALVTFTGGVMSSALQVRYFQLLNPLSIRHF